MGLGLGINTNIPSINNQNTLNKLQTPIQSNLQKLSSGSRINSAKDDAAGLAIVERFAGQIMAASQGQRNLSDGISMVQTGEAYAADIQDYTQRARELAVQSSNGILSDSDRSALQQEYQQIQKEVTRITDSAEFNGQKLFNQDKELNMQIGGNEDGSVNLKTHNLQSQMSDFLSSDISTPDGANASLKILDETQEMVNSVRVDYGAMNNRFESVISNQSNKALNLENAKSRIMDTDYAKQTSELTRNMILNDFAMTMQGHANSAQGHVMKLLQA
ncbi:MAG: flagellin FliC [Gammaproteobacteria bacterium]|nr:flagellin FliC [Gammaproteobacteria bacterium]